MRDITFTQIEKGAQSMNKDRRTLYIASYVACALLLLSLFVSTRYNELLCAFLMSAIAVLISLVVKKRAIYAYTKRQITALMCFIGFLCVSLYILNGLIFGFAKPFYTFSLHTLWRYILPIAVAVIASELLRAVMLAQGSKHTDRLSYVICVLCEILLSSTIKDINSFYIFVDVTAQVFLPAVISNLLYHYLSRRYGAAPNIAYRLFISLYPYIIPVGSAMPQSLYATIKLFVPILIYFFIDATYEKKKKNALAKKHVAGYALSALGIVVSVLYVMLISCQFRFGLLVIATPSMTGEINQGDAIIYEAYEEQKIEVGQILVFEKDGSTIVHRVVEIEHTNGQTRYITKGDANESNDSGYITASNVIGIVGAKLPLVGQPTLWLRDLFK